MRFAQAHKGASYLMVFAALLALSSGSGVSPLVTLVGALALVGSWWWEPPRVRLDRWAVWWSVASVIVFVAVIAIGFTAVDWFGAGASFLVWLVVAKAFNRRSSKDWQQLHIISFLMLVAGSVFEPGLTYAVAFVAFVVSSTWALILSHLRREMEDNFLLKHTDERSDRVEVRRILASRRIVDTRFFAGTGAMSLAVIAAAVVMFLAIPRVGAGFFMRKKEPLTFAGFNGEHVKLGGHGTIKGDPTVVMRVEVPPAYRGRNAPYIHWRGVAFDEYSHGEWRRSANAPRSDIRESPSRGRMDRRFLFGAHQRDLANAVQQTIFLDPIGTDVLFGASMPIAFEYDDQSNARRRERNDEVRFDHQGPVRYTVWSNIERPDPDVLRRAPHVVPEGFGVFTDWPRDQITRDTILKAREITEGLDNDFDKAFAIETYLHDTYAYTLDLEEPGDREPIDFFLFERKKGHCEYFASAFAILARINGIPTRQVNGFLGGEWNEYDDYIAVRAGDAHSWNEVYFEGVGWVTFDATPASQDRLGRGGTGLGARIRRFLDSVRFEWAKWVLQYDLGKQVGLFKSVGRSLKDAGRWVKRHWLPIAAIVAAPLLLLLAWRLARWRREREVEPARPKPRPRSPIAHLYARVLARLEKRGIARAPGVTPRELAREVAGKGLPFAGALGELTEIYYAAQWGGAADLEPRARALAEEIHLSR